MQRNWWRMGVVVVVLSLVAGLLNGCGREAATPGAASRGSATPVTQEWLQQNARMGVAGMDAHSMDFSGLTPDQMAHLVFDSKTQWPAQSLLPRGFDAAATLADLVNPGLGLRRLHQQGITGKTIHVAMIDKYILPDHKELAGHIEYVEAFPDAQSGRSPHFHGMATASIMVGATNGVAPGAFLHYYAVPDDSKGFGNYIVALGQILDRNQTLPVAERIRVVSVSWGPRNKTEERDWAALLDRAKEQGVAVVAADGRSGVAYFTAKLLPGGDPDEPNDYNWDDWILSDRTRKEQAAAFLGVTAANKVTASVAAPDAYVHWGESGQSWAIPYMAGLLTIGLQVKPDATFDELYLAIAQTAVANRQGVRMVNPAAYLASLGR